MKIVESECKCYVCNKKTSGMVAALESGWMVTAFIINLPDNCGVPPSYHEEVTFAVCNDCSPVMFKFAGKLLKKWFDRKRKAKEDEQKRRSDFVRAARPDYPESYDDARDRVRQMVDEYNRGLSEGSGIAGTPKQPLGFAPLRPIDGGKK